jgi:phosphatidylglycerol:prolipoprotein diacylglycerol transferase
MPRYDLGLLEMLFTLCVATLLALTWSRKVRVGTYVAATALTYGPVRFVMDYLRITEGVNADPRYAGLTPAQWCCLALTGLGLTMVGIMFRHHASGFDPGTLVMAGSDSGEESVKRAEVRSKVREVDEEPAGEADDESDDEKPEAP